MGVAAVRSAIVRVQADGHCSFISSPAGASFMSAALLHRTPLHRLCVSTDVDGHEALNSIFGEKTIATRIDDIAVQFQYNLATRDVVSSTSGTGNNTLSDSLVTVGSGGTSNSTAQLQSKKWVRYRPGHEGFAYFTAGWLTPPAHANGKALAGPRDDNDGFAIGYQGSSFGVLRRRKTVDSFAAQADWNLDRLDGTGPSRATLDPTKLNIFGIRWAYLGIAPITFYWHSGRTRGWIPFHCIDLTNRQQEVSVLNPVLPIRFSVANGGASTNVRMFTGSWNAGTVGFDPNH